MTIARINAVRIERMRAALTAKAQSYDGLSLVSGLSKAAVTRWIKTLRELDPKQVYIAEWGDDSRGRKFVAKFKWGNKPDAARPGKTKDDPAERMRNLRARRRLERESSC